MRWEGFEPIDPTVKSRLLYLAELPPREEVSCLGVEPRSLGLKVRYSTS